MQETLRERSLHNGPRRTIHGYGSAAGVTPIADSTFTMTVTAEGYWFFGVYTDVARTVAVDWGDGSAVENFVSTAAGEYWYVTLDHTYLAAGSKTISVTSGITGIDAFSATITALDVTACESLWYLEVGYNSIATLDLTGCPLAKVISIANNDLNSAAVDAILVTLAAGTVSDPYAAVYLTLNAVPGAAGLAAKAVLENVARGPWTVTVDT
jgi:hypothetical protein